MGILLAQRPYLLKAFYNWIVDSKLTPHIIVNATEDGVDVPRAFVENGKIILNIAPGSVHEFVMDENAVTFSARFGGKPMQVYVPIHAIGGIYARENGEGTVFADETVYEALKKQQKKVKNKIKKAILTVVK